MSEKRIYELESQGKDGKWYGHDNTDDLEEAKQWVIGWSEEYPGEAARFVRVD